MSSWNGQQSPPGGSECGESGGESGRDSEGAGSGTASSAGSRVHKPPPHTTAHAHSEHHHRHHSHHHHRAATHRAHRGPKTHHFHLAGSASGGNSSDTGPSDLGAAATTPSGRDSASSGDGATIAQQLEHMVLTDDKESDNYDEHDTPTARRTPPSIFPPPGSSVSGNLSFANNPNMLFHQGGGGAHFPSAKSGSYQSLASMAGSEPATNRATSPMSLRLTPAHRSRSRSLDSIHSQLTPPPPPEKSLFPNGMIFGIDIGGTLGKIVFREPAHIPAGPQAEQVKRLREHFLRSSSYDADKEEDDGLIVACPVFAGTLRFISFPTSRIDVIFEIIRNERSFSPNEVSNWKVFATGGGAFKYEKRFWDELGVHVRKSDEMETLVSGVQCLIESVADECFTWCPAESLTSKGQARRAPGGTGANKRHLENTDEFIKKTIMLEKAAKPWMVVNVGSGVSMLKIDEQMTVRFGKVGTYKRVGGTPLGGGTFLALGCILTGANSHAELLELAQRGNSKNVDKLVGDIYGDDYVGLGLSADTVASSFGNLVNPDVRNKVKREDLAAALIQMISWNIAQLARLVAQQEGVKTIVFTGSFMNKNELAQKKLASSIRYWSNNDSVALFMRHEGYVGAVGALAMSNVHKKAPETPK